MYGKPSAGEEWPTTHYTSMVQVFENESDPSDISIIQFENKKDKKWVELPACTGESGEKKLNDNLSNATVATCKVHPDISATGKANSAASALDSMTPKAE